MNKRQAQLRRRLRAAIRECNNLHRSIGSSMEGSYADHHCHAAAENLRTALRYFDQYTTSEEGT